MTIEEIKIANATYRRKGSSVFDKDGNIRSVVARFVESNIDKDKKILDYGCGSEFIQGNHLRKLGFDVDGWDIGTNKPKDGVDKLEQIYDVVYASNVLNVLSSTSMLMETLDQIYGCLKDGGVFIANYPAAPRKMVIDSRCMKEIIQNRFGGGISMVGGTSSTPIWCVVKTQKHKRIAV
jgi:SAM-dependent methyltransferase